MGNKIPQYLLQPACIKYKLASPKKVKLTFLDKTLLNSASAAKSIYLHSENAKQENLIYKIHPHIKLISLIYVVVIISVLSNLYSQAFVTILISSLFLFAKLKIIQVYRKIFLLAFIFGFLVILPASLNIITPGDIILNIITLKNPVHFWIYNIPQNIGFTKNGIHVVTLVFLRVINSVSFSMLIVCTTSFPSFVKSFKILGVPDTFLMVIYLAYKYIFILSRTIEETYLALKSRLLSNIKNRKIRNLVGGRIFFTFKRSMIIYENTYYAMTSRGYQGKIVLHSQNRMNANDYIALIFIVLAGLCVIFL